MTKLTPDPDSWLRVIKDMLDDDSYKFAEEYLTSVKEFIETENRITTNQTKAILKIRRSAQ